MLSAERVQGTSADLNVRPVVYTRATTLGKAGLPQASKPLLGIPYNAGAVQLCGGKKCDSNNGKQDTKTKVASTICLLAGIWFFISPWVYGYDAVNRGRFINSLCVGVILFVAAISSTNSTHHTQHPVVTRT